MTSLLLPALLLAAVEVLWREPPVATEHVNFSESANKAPEPRAPFQFVTEEVTGNSPKVIVRDANGATWQVKGGLESRADAFVTRLVSALGYYADSITFVREGRIEGVHWPLKRAG